MQNAKTESKNLEGRASGVLSAKKRAKLERLLDPYVKGAEVWVTCRPNEWKLGKLKECKVNEAEGTVAMTILRQIEDQREYDGYFEKRSKFEEGGSWVREQTEDPRVVKITYKAGILDIVDSHFELPDLRNPEMLDGVDDLTNLSYLNEPAILHDLRVRFEKRKIYTNSGVLLVALNPYAHTDLYGEKNMKKYVGQTGNKTDPHLYAIAENAYNGMANNKRSQSIIVYGESGAGKTTSAKHIMRYFAQARMGESGNSMTHVERQLLATNPVFEAFGNAKTTRNDNSSRFGKYLEIFFDFDEQTIVGADTRTFLLERSRVCNYPDTERNYHIFYQFLAGADEGIREKCKIGNRGWKDFNYLNKGGCGHIQDVDDVYEFGQTREALELVGVESGQQEDIWRVLGAILHIGNVEITSDNNWALIDVYGEDKSFKAATELLGIDSTKFEQYLTKKTIDAQREKILTRITRTQGIALRDSVAKFLYSRMFGWILGPLNSALKTKEITNELFVGVLDIYGFEYFEVNSFEQLCINYANEKLQQHFNQHVLQLEQEVYVREQLENWEFIEFRDNRPCIELIEGRLGILAILDEQCRLESATDKSFIEKLYYHFGKENVVMGNRERKIEGNSGNGNGNGVESTESIVSSYFGKPRFSNTGFIIQHYAYSVVYEGEGFLEKNKDSVSEEIIDLLKNSSNGFVRELVVEEITHSTIKSNKESAGAKTTISTGRGGGGGVGGTAKLKKQYPTLGVVFRKSLDELIATITSTDMHYIRCIKTNIDKQSWQFEAGLIASQLRSCGVIETIKISKSGYPSRVNLLTFNERYRLLIPEETRRELVKLYDKSSEEEVVVLESTLDLVLKDSSPKPMELENKRGQENEKNKIVSGASMERRRSSDREKGKGEITVRITNADRELSKEILRECIGDTRQYQVGLSKVFFRAGQWAKMEHLRKQLLGKSATVIQKYVRRMIMRNRFISYKGSVFVIQNWWANEMVQRLRVARVRVKFFQLVKRKVMEYREQAAREAAAVAERKAKEEAARIEELRAKQKLLEVKMAEEQEMPRGNMYQRMYGLPCREWMVPTTSYDQHIWNKAAKSPFLSNYGPHEQVYCYTSDDEVVKQLVERRRTEVLQESAKSSKRRDNDNDGDINALQLKLRRNTIPVLQSSGPFGSSVAFYGRQMRNMTVVDKAEGEETDTDGRSGLTYNDFLNETFDKYDSIKLINSSDDDVDAVGVGVGVGVGVDGKRGLDGYSTNQQVKSQIKSEKLKKGDSNSSSPTSISEVLFNTISSVNSKQKPKPKPKSDIDLNLNLKSKSKSKSNIYGLGISNSDDNNNNNSNNNNNNNADTETETEADTGLTNAYALLNLGSRYQRTSQKSTNPVMFYGSGMRVRSKTSHGDVLSHTMTEIPTSYSQGNEGTYEQHILRSRPSLLSNRILNTSASERGRAYTHGGKNFSNEATKIMRVNEYGTVLDIQPTYQYSTGLTQIQEKSEVGNEGNKYRRANVYRAEDKSKSRSISGNGSYHRPPTSGTYNSRDGMMVYQHQVDVTEMMNKQEKTREIHRNYRNILSKLNTSNDMGSVMLDLSSPMSLSSSPSSVKPENKSTSPGKYGSGRHTAARAQAYKSKQPQGQYYNYNNNNNGGGGGMVNSSLAKQKTVHEHMKGIEYEGLLAVSDTVLEYYYNGSNNNSNDDDDNADIRGGGGMVKRKSSKRNSSSYKDTESVNQQQQQQQQQQRAEEEEEEERGQVYGEELKSIQEIGNDNESSRKVVENGSGVGVGVGVGMTQKNGRKSTFSLVSGISKASSFGVESLKKSDRKNSSGEKSGSGSGGPGGNIKDKKLIGNVNVNVNGNQKSRKSTKGGILKFISKITDI